MGKIKHGQAKKDRETKEYICWISIKQRCLNPNSQAHQNYGGAGITICDKWKDNFEAFLSDVGNAPCSSASLDRIDNNKGYEPDNVRWVNHSVQSVNRKIFKNNTSGYKGVNWHKKIKRWVASISINKKQIHLGSFKNIDDAIKARQDAEDKYHKPLLSS